MILSAMDGVLRHSEALADRAPDDLGHLVLGARRIDDDAALRFGSRDLEEDPPAPLVLRYRVTLEPVRQEGWTLQARAAARTRPISTGRSRISVRSGRVGHTAIRSSA